MHNTHTANRGLFSYIEFSTLNTVDATTEQNGNISTTTLQTAISSHLETIRYIRFPRTGRPRKSFIRDKINKHRVMIRCFLLFSMIMRNVA